MHVVAGSLGMKILSVPVALCPYRGQITILSRIIPWHNCSGEDVTWRKLPLSRIIQKAAV